MCKQSGQVLTVEDFLTSYDFMKLGQALHHENWQIAMVTVQRMLKSVQGLGLDILERQLTGIRQCIIHKQARQAKDILALLTAKRAQLLRERQGYYEYERDCP